MKPINSFTVDFNYALSGNITVVLNAKAELHHSNPYYLITDFHLKDHQGKSSLLPDIKIKAVRDEDGICWVHTDSNTESILSRSIGKAIEAKGDFEISSRAEQS